MIDDAITTRALVLDALRNWAERGWMRRLDRAFAAFVADLDPSADGTVVLAAALTAHVEGQGHTCLPLRALLDDPAALLQWPPDGIDALRYVLARTPSDADRWHAALAASRLVASDVDASRLAADAVQAGSADASVESTAASHTDDARGEPLVLSHGRLYLRRYWRHERRIARAVVARGSARLSIPPASARTWIDRLFASHADGARRPDWQRVAAAVALRGRLTIVTGGPGTGKTHTAARLLVLLAALSPDPARLRIALAAPTGKAAARLKQSIAAALDALAVEHPALGFDDGTPLPDWAARLGPARTLHALLGRRRDANRRSRHPRHDAAHPLAVDVLVVDEASMVHVEMMDALLTALPPTARLVLLGDKDQLASVEAGAVLGELCRRADAAHYSTDTVDAIAAIAAEQIPSLLRDEDGTPPDQQTVMLRRSERFGGAINDLARAVNAGSPEQAAAVLDDASQHTAAWIVARAPARLVDLADRGRVGAPGYGGYLALLEQRPDSLFAEDHERWVRAVLAAFDAFRVLCAVRDGPWGVDAVNRALESAFADRLRVAVGQPWYAGRPVIVAKNDYDLGVFNGDVGVALPAGPDDPRLRVHFADGTVVRSVGVSRLAEVETAFAMTVHKAQGSEFAHTALVLPARASRVATRELLYTGVTRARTAFTLVSADRASLAESIDRTTRRTSGIGAMIEALCAP